MDYVVRISDLTDTLTRLLFHPMTSEVSITTPVRDRSDMIEFLRGMADDLENGGAFTKGTLTMEIVGEEEGVKATLEIVGMLEDVQKSPGEALPRCALPTALSRTWSSTGS